MRAIWQADWEETFEWTQRLVLTIYRVDRALAEDGHSLEERKRVIKGLEPEWRARSIQALPDGGRALSEARAALRKDGRPL